MAKLTALQAITGDGQGSDQIYLVRGNNSHSATLDQLSAVFGAQIDSLVVNWLGAGVIDGVDASMNGSELSLTLPRFSVTVPDAQSLGLGNYLQTTNLLTALNDLATKPYRSSSWVPSLNQVLGKTTTQNVPWDRITQPTGADIPWPTGDLEVTRAAVITALSGAANLLPAANVDLSGYATTEQVENSDAHVLVFDDMLKLMQAVGLNRDNWKTPKLLFSLATKDMFVAGPGEAFPFEPEIRHRFEYVPPTASAITVRTTRAGAQQSHFGQVLKAGPDHKVDLTVTFPDISADTFNNFLFDGCHVYVSNDSHHVVTVIGQHADLAKRKEIKLLRGDWVMGIFYGRDLQWDFLGTYGEPLSQQKLWDQPSIRSILPLGNGRILGASEEGLYESLDHGKTWEDIEPQMFSATGTSWQRFMHQGRIGPVYNDDGYTLASSNLYNDINFKSFGYFSSMALCRGGRIVAVAEKGTGLFKATNIFISDDGGHYWARTEFNYDDAHDRNTLLYMGGESLLMGIGPNAMMGYSTDNGIQWEELKFDTYKSDDDTGEMVLDTEGASNINSEDDEPYVDRMIHVGDHTSLAVVNPGGFVWRVERPASKNGDLTAKASLVVQADNYIAYRVADVANLGGGVVVMTIGCDPENLIQTFDSYCYVIRSLDGGATWPTSEDVEGGDVTKGYIFPSEDSHPGNGYNYISPIVDLGGGRLSVTLAKLKQDGTQEGDAAHYYSDDWGLDWTLVSKGGKAHDHSVLLENGVTLVSYTGDGLYQEVRMR